MPSHISVSVEFWSPSIPKVKRKLQLAEGSSVANLLDALAEEYGEKFERELIGEKGEKPHAIVFVNEKKAADMKKELHDRDEVTLMPLIAGG